MKDLMQVSLDMASYSSCESSSLKWSQIASRIAANMAILNLGNVRVVLERIKHTTTVQRGEEFGSEAGNF